jgi:hypothetical protein
MCCGLGKCRSVISDQVIIQRSGFENIIPDRPVTRGGRPWILIHKEPHRTKTEALQRERFLKSGAGRKWLDEHFPQYRRSGTSK